ncbi:MAG: DNA-3-methyladenine glycosylase family protein, partial [Pyrinomonadaceae bacterium]
HLACWPTLFEALVISILSQQISTAVAMTFKRRFVERFGEWLSQGGQDYFAFPRPEKIARAAVEDLRALGLSGAKATSILDLARAVDESQLDDEALKKQDNETVIVRLSQLRGVGRWTAEWALMLYFGREDVFPAGDLFLRGALVKYYNKGEPLSEKEIRALAARRWDQWSSYAALYLIAGLRAGSVKLKE